MKMSILYLAKIIEKKKTQSNCASIKYIYVDYQLDNLDNLDIIDENAMHKIRCIAQNWQMLSVYRYNKPVNTEIIPYLNIKQIIKDKNNITGIL